MSQNGKVRIVQCGREISSQELDEIVETFRMFPGLGRTELIETICENLSWFTPSGKPKKDACRKLLKKLEAEGMIEFPPKKKDPQNKNCTARKITETSRTDPQPELSGKLSDFEPVKLGIVRYKKKRELFNEYLFRYHYLGYSKPFGCYICYFIKYNNKILGCVLFAGAGKSLGVRDKWIGWTDNQRLSNLPWVINNTRFLIFPWVQIKNLASHILGQIARRIGDDWYREWGYSPVLMETFVDPEYYAGSCYKGAGWQHLGMTTGEGLARKGKSYKTTPKMIFVKPLSDNFASFLHEKHTVNEELYE